MAFGIWVIIRDKDGKEVARIKVPGGGAAEIRPTTSAKLGMKESPPLAVAPFDSMQARAHQEAWAKYLKTNVEITNTGGAKMILIPPGEFLMGSSDEVAAAVKTATEIRADQGTINRIGINERPQHKVVVMKPFRMSVTEVTIAQFKKFASAASYKTEAEKVKADASVAPGAVVASPATPRKIPTYLNPGYPVSEDSPVAVITWNDAVAYCEWLSKHEKAVYRLPTEAEWEFACRAGTTTQYSFGDDHNELRRYGWHVNNSSAQAHPVGMLLPNPFGLFDMHGNLFEWCADYFSEQRYERTSPIDPTGPSDGSKRVISSGTWSGSAAGSRSASRSAYEPSHLDKNGGFRLAMEIPSATSAP